VNPNPIQISALQSNTSIDWTQPLATIASNLNTVNISNPTPQGTVPTPFVFAAILEQLNSTGPSLGKLMALPYLSQIITDIRNQDRGAIATWAVALSATGIITSDEAASITTLVESTVPDPTWQSQLSWASINIGRPVDVNDLNYARPAGNMAALLANLAAQPFVAALSGTPVLYQTKADGTKWYTQSVRQTVGNISTYANINFYVVNQGQSNEIAYYTNYLPAPQIAGS
jgi:hypothetical protein